MITDNKIEMYLLNELAEEESELISEELIENKEVLKKLKIVEMELIDSYVRNELPNNKRELFEKYYLVIPSNFAKVKEARLFHNRLHEAIVPAIVPNPSDVIPAEPSNAVLLENKNIWNSFSFLNLPKNILIPSAVFSFILLILIGGYLIYFNRSENPIANSQPSSNQSPALIEKTPEITLAEKDSNLLVEPKINNSNVNLNSLTSNERTSIAKVNDKSSKGESSRIFGKDNSNRNNQSINQNKVGRLIDVKLEDSKIEILGTGNNSCDSIGFDKQNIKDNIPLNFNYAFEESRMDINTKTNYLLIIKNLENGNVVMREGKLKKRVKNLEIRELIPSRSLSEGKYEITYYLKSKKEFMELKTEEEKKDARKGLFCKDFVKTK